MKIISSNAKVVIVLFISVLVFVLTLVTFLHGSTFSATKNVKVAGTHFAGIHVVGNHLVDRTDQTVVLHGVNRSGAEYACIQGDGFFDGPADAASVAAIASWHTNVVRVPMNEDCWLGTNGASSQYSGKNYQQAIINYVNLLNHYGQYVILNLHYSGTGTKPAVDQVPMPDQKFASSFWKSVAEAFKTNLNVIFDVFNEPYPDNNRDTPAAWQCVRNGGICPGVSYPTVGMQELVNVIRSTGAQNVLMIPGVQYSSGLSHWIEYKPTDPLNNLAVSWHLYPASNTCGDSLNAGCYDTIVAPIAMQFPIITGELGESEDESVCGVKQTNIALAWLDAQHISYLEWTWDSGGTWNTRSCAGLPLITDYQGTPKSPNGVNYKNHLAAISASTILLR